MSVPLILTILAGAATFIGAFLGVLGQKPSNRLLAFSLGFAHLINGNASCRTSS